MTRSIKKRNTQELKARESAWNEDVTKALKEIIEDDSKTAIYTDRDYVTEINYMTGGNLTLSIWRNTMNLKPELRTLIENARLKQKRLLLEKLMTTEKNWQRYAWILERKFSDFNLQTIREHKHTVEPIQIVFPQFNKKQVIKQYSE